MITIKILQLRENIAFRTRIEKTQLYKNLKENNNKL